MLNNITNFFNLLKRGKVKKTLAPNDMITIGVRNPVTQSNFQPSAIFYKDLETQLGNAVIGNPLIGTLVGGGILVGIWNESGVKKGLIASLTNLATNVPWTIPAFQSTPIGATAENFYEGSTNTLAIIAQTGLPASTSYAAGVAKLHLGGGYNDWYLPSPWELTMCYANAAIVNRILGVNGFIKTGYHASAESGSVSSWWLWFLNGNTLSSSKDSLTYVRAVRIHTF
jgi:hypothetical protein